MSEDLSLPETEALFERGLHKTRPVSGGRAAHPPSFIPWLPETRV